MRVKSCGTCGLCCKLMAIPALEKPRHSWCPKYVMRTGCGIYADRPAACREFLCLYMLAPELDDAWRPDRARFMIWTGQEDRRLIVGRQKAVAEKLAQKNVEALRRDFPTHSSAFHFRGAGRR